MEKLDSIQTSFLNHIGISEQEAFLKVGGDPGCSYCGGLGHRITACPKLEAMNHKKSATGGKDYLASNADDY